MPSPGTSTAPGRTAALASLQSSVFATPSPSASTNVAPGGLTTGVTVPVGGGVGVPAGIARNFARSSK